MSCAKIRLKCMHACVASFSPNPTPGRRWGWNKTALRATWPRVMGFNWPQAQSESTVGCGCQKKQLMGSALIEAVPARGRKWPPGWAAMPGTLSSALCPVGEGVQSPGRWAEDKQSEKQSCEEQETNQRIWQIGEKTSRGPRRSL